MGDTGVVPFGFGSIELGIVSFGILLLTVVGKQINCHGEKADENEEGKRNLSHMGIIIESAGDAVLIDSCLGLCVGDGFF